MGGAEVSLLSVDEDIRPRWRDESEALVRRMGLLRAEDRVLLEMQVKHGCSYEQLGRLSGLSGRQVARRIRGLTRRLTAEEYVTIYRHKARFSDEELEAAYDRYLLGLGYRTIAGKRGVSKFRARRILGKLAAFLQDQQD